MHSTSATDSAVRGSAPAVRITWPRLQSPTASPLAWTCILMSYDRRRLRRLEWLGIVRLLQNGRLSEPLLWFYNQNGRDSGVHGFVQHYWTTSLFERFLVAHFNVRGQRAWERYDTFVQLDGTDLYMTGRDSEGRAVRAAMIAFFFKDAMRSAVLGFARSPACCGAQDERTCSTACCLVRAARPWSSMAGTSSR